MVLSLKAPLGTCAPNTHASHHTAASVPASRLPHTPESPRQHTRTLSHCSFLAQHSFRIALRANTDAHSAACVLACMGPDNAHAQTQLRLDPRHRPHSARQSQTAKLTLHVPTADSHTRTPRPSLAFPAHRTQHVRPRIQLPPTHTRLLYLARTGRDIPWREREEAT